MRTVIKNLLKEKEQHHGVRILYACESGSRAWGFPSADSDYDIRFIYLREREAYLSVGEVPDQIGDPPAGDLDLCGWDLRKALRLLLRSNVTPFEWIQSPVVYAADDVFVEAFRRLLPHYFSPRAQARHYLGIVVTQFGDVKGEAIRMKKLCYVLRSLLSADWILSRNEHAPMEMHTLMALLPEDIRDEVSALIAAKAHGTEKDTTVLSATLNDFITRRLAWATERAATWPPDSFCHKDLDAFFQAFV